MLKKSEPELNKNTKNNFIDYTSLNDKHKRRFTLSHQIVILITLVVCIALLPASLFTTYRVSKVIYDRVSINAVSINNILCNSAEIKDGLVVPYDANKIGRAHV